MEIITKLVLFVLKAYAIIATLSILYAWKFMAHFKSKIKMPVEKWQMLILLYALSIYAWFV